MTPCVEERLAEAASRLACLGKEEAACVFYPDGLEPRRGLEYDGPVPASPGYMVQLDEDGWLPRYWLLPSSGTWFQRRFYNGGFVYAVCWVRAVSDNNYPTLAYRQKPT